MHITLLQNSLLMKRIHLSWSRKIVLQLQHLWHGLNAFISIRQLLLNWDFKRLRFKTEWERMDQLFKGLSNCIILFLMLHNSRAQLIGLKSPDFFLWAKQTQSKSKPDSNSGVTLTTMVTVMFLLLKLKKDLETFSKAKFFLKPNQQFWEHSNLPKIRAKQITNMETTTLKKANLEYFWLHLGKGLNIGKLLRE